VIDCLSYLFTLGSFFDETTPDHLRIKIYLRSTASYENSFRGHPVIVITITLRFQELLIADVAADMAPLA
jgi:hypothetical protein